jgi:D-methionine transport system permease protein
MLLAIVLMILLVHAVQFFGTRLSRAADKR